MGRGLVCATSRHRPAILACRLLERRVQYLINRRWSRHARLRLPPTVVSAEPLQLEPELVSHEAEVPRERDHGDGGDRDTTPCRGALSWLCLGFRQKKEKKDLNKKAQGRRSSVSLDSSSAETKNFLQSAVAPLQPLPGRRKEVWGPTAFGAVLQ